MRNASFYFLGTFRFADYRRTVTVYDAFFGFPFTSSYDLDENYIRIRTNTSDLLLEIKDSKTLVGDGWARGIYTKVE